MPLEENQALFLDDEDFDSEDAFEIGLDKANKNKPKDMHLNEESDEDSFAKPNLTGNKAEPKYTEIYADIMNQSAGQRRRIQTANKTNMDK